MAKPQIFQIPFDNEGNQLHYPEYNRYTMLDNFEFTETLQFGGYARGRSAAYFYFTRKSTGKHVIVFMTDFCAMVPFMISGEVTGKFTFCKRGQNYGCKLIEGVMPKAAEIAEKLILNILYDNGIVNRQEPEFIDPAWVARIAPVADRFFTLHPYLLTDKVLDDIAAGDIDEIELRLAHLEGFAELSQLLNDFFNDGDQRNG